jgi:Vanillate O-demethylase oxygenase C-terminal domain
VLFRDAEGRPRALADRWLEMRWNAPACLALWSGGVRSGEPRASGRELPGAHLFTPETATSTHYFFGSGLSRTLGPNAQQAVRDAVAVERPVRPESTQCCDRKSRAALDGMKK